MAKEKINSKTLTEDEMFDKVAEAMAEEGCGLRENQTTEEAARRIKRVLTEKRKRIVK